MGWSFNDGKPIYQQIINHIEFLILSGQYKPGDKLESVRELAAIAGVNPNTMQKALQEMEGMGLLNTQRTSGRFITEDGDTIRRLRGNVAEEKTASYVLELKNLGYSIEEILEIVRKQDAKKSKAIGSLEDLIKEEEKNGSNTSV